jgi:DNA modification methylase
VERPSTRVNPSAECLITRKGWPQITATLSSTSNKRKQIVGYRPSRQKPHLREFTGYLNSVLEFHVDELGLHPVAKPVGLLEFLIETYTRLGEIVLDSAMGTGSTGIAAANTGRRFIGIENDAKFFQTAVQVLGYSRPESG